MIDHPRKPPRLLSRLPRRLALYVLAPLLLILELPVGIHIARKPDFGLGVRNLQIMRIEPGSEAAALGLRGGDRLLALDGHPLRTMVDYYVQTAGRYDLHPRTFRFSRGDKVFSTLIQPTRPKRAKMVWDYGISVAGLAFLLMGWLIYQRRDDVVARYFFTLCMVFAFFLMDVPNWPSPGYMLFKEFIRDIAHLILPVAVLRFLLCFPDRINLLPKTQRRHRLLWLPALPLLLMTIVAHLFQLDPASPPVHLLQLFSTLFFLGYIAAGLVIFGRKIVRHDQPARHTKLRLAMVGMLAGFIPFLVGALLQELAPGGGLPYQEWLAFGIVLVPISFGLAIMRYGALDLEFVIRHSLIYATLTICIVLGFVLVVGLLGHALTSYFHTGSFPIAMLAVVAAALVLNPARNRLQFLIDRAFYPSRMATREALQELSQELSGVIGEQIAVETMLSRLHGLYRPLDVALLLLDGDHYRLGGVFCETDRLIDVDSVSLPIGATLELILFRARRPVYVEEIEGLDTAQATDADTLRLLDVLGSQLIVPLFSHNRMSGFLSFGPKNSGTLYTQSDISNLHYFSFQAAALVEIKQLYQDRIEKERMETELSVARRIQSQLVPTEPLDANGLRIIGLMNSCREIGGDYFDYFPLDNSTVGFAIADAVGKGVPAALLMSTLRSAFRAMAVRHLPPEEVVSRLNRNICAMVESGQLVSFFYGILDTSTRRLTYANAGMNPPLLLRNGQTYIERLRRGGLMLGIDPDRSYAHGSVRLGPGDLIFLYTDGITEETGLGGEFYGETRLETLIRNHANSDIDSLLARVQADLDGFSTGEQADDRTVILLRINEMQSQA